MSGSDVGGGAQQQQLLLGPQTAARRVGVDSQSGGSARRDHRPSQAWKHNRGGGGLPKQTYKFSPVFTSEVVAVDRVNKVLKVSNSNTDD